MRRPREAYVRYCYYASMVESIKNWNGTRQEDEEFCANLDLFDLGRNIFPRLTQLGLIPPDGAFWFPLCFRNQSVTGLSIRGAPTVRGIIRDVSRYCPRLTRFTVSSRLHETEIDLLQAHRFIYLTNLYIHVPDAHVDNVMRIILFISHNLTDLTLNFHGNVSIHTVRRGKSFSSLKNLTLKRLFSVANSIDKLPTAPQLESLYLESCTSDLANTEDADLLFAAVVEYGKRSPFTRLLIDGAPFARAPLRRVDLNLGILTEIDRITDLTCILALPSGVLFPGPSRPMVWRQLRTLNLVLGMAQIPLFSLEDFFRITSQAPYLTDATACMDLSRMSSPVLNTHSHPAEYQETETVESRTLEGSFPDMDQFRTVSLRSINFRSSHLLYDDQRFLFSTLRDLAPNLRISTRMLESLVWYSQSSRESAIGWVRANIKGTFLSMEEFTAFLFQSSESFAT
jgi:hypothetical protein